MLYLIGLGLYSAEDLTLRAINILKQCDEIYLDIYTSQFVQGNKTDIEKLIGKKINRASRSVLEEHVSEIIETSNKKNVAILVIGSPTAATTHMSILKEAKEKGIAVEVIENASVLTAVGITGLQLYKFGQVTTIPADNKNITTPADVVKKNQQYGLHTLCLLDIKESKLMSAREGLDYLIRNGVNKNTRIIACGALGSPNPEIRIGPASSITLKKFPQCFIIPGTLHFTEEEMLDLWQNQRVNDTVEK